jgi:hypothetical protein
LNIQKAFSPVTVKRDESRAPVRASNYAQFSNIDESNIAFSQTTITLSPELQTHGAFEKKRSPTA